MYNRIRILNFRKIIQRSYECKNYWQKYRKNRKIKDFEKRCIDVFYNKINKPNCNVLDMGCGTGEPYDAYLINKGCKLTGIDFSKFHINQAKCNFPDATFICQNFFSFNSNIKFDGIVLFYSFFHIHRSEHKKLLLKLYSLLSPNGAILMNVRKEDSGDIKYKDNFCGLPMCWSHYDYQTFSQLVISIGFTITLLGDEKDYGSNESHLWIIMQKKFDYLRR